ncbi:hypothetical protein H0A36_20330 [Endozoicomonas sp. SM1973]|uniref:J domain-containing protein n=1 Tax=Spartinivicinus marinus TaxID=2994442 RepID=A0A853I6I9_9GAMM|nr:hypothetical protein [Spartinivicinus marinus]MCX4028006.1 hypothetical protein [Spartinivicinus marinus]NYZ68369.1 hypothetical protein [Spartinivicinus marinus]
MSCWDILGIESTEDIKKIKHAYASKLKLLDLATQQALFEELRRALEHAKVQAQSGLQNQSLPFNSRQKPKAQSLVVTQLDDFVIQLEILYADFPRRIQLEEWQRLLADLPHWTLDRKQTISDVLFGFLLENYYLPPTILVYLEQQFAWGEQQLQLIKHYNETDIERLFALIKQPLEFPSFEFLQDLPSQLSDRYIELCWTGRQALLNNHFDKALNCLLKAYGIYKKDPYLLRLLGNAFERVGRKNQALDCYYAGSELVKDDY